MGSAVVFTNVSFRAVLCAVVIAGLLIPATAARVHVKVAPDVVLVGV
jgi:NhaP-type Na+/H+ and K+/H+ antiporter